MDNYLESVKKQFNYYKQLGEKAMAQVPDDQLHWQHNVDSNGIAIMVKHLWGNMMSRWTNFLTEDGEKEWRERDAEFENDLPTRKEILDKWEAGWKCLFDAIDPLNADDLQKIIYIRNEGHTVMEAINRQLCHYTYHVGQIVFLAKMLAEQWESLSIPRGASTAYNAKKFSEDKGTRHFTDDWVDDKG